MPITYPERPARGIPSAVSELPLGAGVTQALAEPRQPDTYAYRSAYYPPPGPDDPRNDTITTVPAFPLPYAAPNQLDDYGREDETMRRAYLDLHKQEPSLRSAILGKVAAVASLDVAVIPEDEDSDADQRAAKFVRWAVENTLMGWDGLIKKVLEPGLLMGWSVTEIVLKGERDSRKWGGYWTLRDCKSKDTSLLKLRLDAYRNVAGIVSTIRGLAEYPLWKVILFSHNELFENPFGTSDLRSAYRASKLIDSAYQLWYTSLKNFSGPFLRGKYSQPITRSQLETALKAARAGGWITHHKDDDVEVLSLAAASSFDAFERKVDKLRQEIFLAVRGAYLPFLEGTAQDARGDTAINKMASNDVEFLLAKVIGRVLSFQLVPALVRPNFGNEAGLPRIVLGGVNWAETKTQLEVADQLLNRFEAPISKKWLYTVSQVPPPEDDGDILLPPRQVQAQEQQQAAQQPPPDAPPAAGEPADPQTPPDDAPSLSSPETADKVADFFASLPASVDADWAQAVFLSAFDESGHDLDAAIELARAALVDQPNPPATGEQFGWSAGSTKDGHTKAIGTGEQAGQTLYGKQAEDALQAQSRRSGGGSESESPQASSGGKLKQVAGQIKQKVSAANSQLDSALTSSVGKPYTALKSAVNMAHHGMMVVMEQSQKLAAQAARERGLPEEKVKKIAQTMAACDFAFSFAMSKGGLIVSGGNVAASFAAGMLPSASLGYLVYSTARNPKATLSAAKKLVSGQLKKAHSEQFGWTAGTTKDGNTKAVGTGEHAGETRYGDDAERALQGGQDKGGSESKPVTEEAKTSVIEGAIGKNKPLARQVSSRINRIHQAVRAGELSHDQAQDQLISVRSAAHSKAKSQVIGLFKQAEQEVVGKHGDTDIVRGLIAHKKSQINQLLSDLYDAIDERAMAVVNDDSKEDRVGKTADIDAAMGRIQAVIASIDSYVVKTKDPAEKARQFRDVIGLVKKLQAGKKVKPELIAATQQNDQFYRIQQRDDGWRIETPEGDQKGYHFQVGDDGTAQMYDSETGKPTSPREIDARWSSKKGHSKAFARAPGQGKQVVGPAGEIRPWDPKYPDFATDRRSVPADEFEPANLDRWVDAPHDSHVARFLLEADPKSILGKYVGAVLHVEFKQPTQQGMSFYQYFFGKDFERAREVYRKMRATVHPGEIVHSDLIEGQVRYEAYA